MKKQDFKNIGKYNKLLYGELDPELIEEAKSKVNPFNQKFDLGRPLFIFEVVEKVKQHLKKRNIEAKIVLESEL